eukprot:gene17341-biopygen7653
MHDEVDVHVDDDDRRATTPSNTTRGPVCKGGRRRGMWEKSEERDEWSWGGAWRGGDANRCQEMRGDADGIYGGGAIAARGSAAAGCRRPTLLGSSMGRGVRGTRVWVHRSWGARRGPFGGEAVSHPSPNIAEKRQRGAHRRAARAANWRDYATPLSLPSLPSLPSRFAFRACYLVLLSASLPPVLAVPACLALPIPRYFGHELDSGGHQKNTRAMRKGRRRRLVGCETPKSRRRSAARVIAIRTALT